MEGILSNTGAMKLEGANNWTVWKFQIKVMLKALGIFDTVESCDSSEAESKQTEKDKTWQQKDAKAQGVIVTRLSNNALMQIISCESAKDIWERLHTIYEQKSSLTLHLLQQKFFDMKFESSKNDISTFVGKVEEVVNQLKEIKNEIPKNMIITKIITALPDEYKHFVSAWESVSEERQTMPELVARLLVEEQRMSSKQEVTAFVSKSVMNKKCFGCGKKGHFKSDCKAKAKFCENCKKKGHVKADCWFLKDKNSEKRLDKEESTSTNAFVTALCLINIDNDEWIMDSGASEHMSHKKDLFENYVKLESPKSVIMGDGNIIYGEGYGQINIESYNGQRWIPTTLNNVLYVPDIKVNLFSAISVLDRKYVIQSDENYCKIIKNEKVCALAKRKGKIFVMMVKKSFEEVNIATTSCGLSDWHSKMAHQNIGHIKAILKKNKIEYTMGQEFTCIPCLHGKQHKLPFQRSETTGLRPGQLIHMDICGPMETISLGGARYFLLIKDDYTRYRVIFCLKQKSETFLKVKQFIEALKVNPGHKIETVRSDNGKEFLCKEMKEMFLSNGIVHQTSVVYTPEQNGCAEREMRTVVEAARTMLADSNLEKQLWAEAVNTAVYVLNRTGKSRVENQTPYELWFDGKEYDIRQLQIFGSKVAAHIPNQKRLKWDSKTEIGILVGYGENTKGFRIYYPGTKEINIKRDVIFIKEEKEKSKMTEIDDYGIETETLENNDDNNGNLVNDEINESFESNEEVSISSEEITEQFDSVEERPKRQRQKPKWHDCYVTNFISIYDEPNTYEEAMNSKNKESWTEAIQKEMNTLKGNNTWTEISKVPAGTQVINSKWVFKIKDLPDGGQQYKARLIARGFEESDSDLEVYAPVARLSTFRVFLAVANKKRLPVHQMDVTGAFLYGVIQGDVYMRLPISSTMCKLNK